MTMVQAPSRFWLVRHDASGVAVAKFDTVGETTVPDPIANYSGVSIESVSDRATLESITVDHSVLSESEADVLDQFYPVQDHAPDYYTVMDQIESAATRYGGYWVYQRLLGNTPTEMPDPLENRSSVPGRDANGTPAEQAVADWMDRYERQNSL